MAAPVPPPEIKRLGRPRKPAQPQLPTAGTVGAPAVDLSKKDDEWPKDIPGLWMRTLEWARSEGRGADTFVLWVYQMRGALGTPTRMAPAIHGDQVSGNEAISAGEALIEHLTDIYHMPSTTEAASYRIEIQVRATGSKVRTSEPWALDRPEKIDRIRQAARMRANADNGGYRGSPYMPPARLTGGWPERVQHNPAGDLLGAPPPAAPPSTGNPYVDQFIGQLIEDKRRLETKLEDAQQLASLLPVAPAASPPPATPVLDEDAKQAKLAATVAQSVMQTLITAGVIVPKPVGGPPMPPPTQVSADTAVGTIRTNTATLESVIDELQRAETLKKKMRTFLGVSDEEEAVDPPEIHVEPKDREMRTRRFAGIYKGKDVHMPLYDKDDDDVSFAQKIVNFFGANPEVSTDMIGQIVGVAVTKMADGPLAGVIGQLLAQGGAGAVAAGMARSAVVNGAGASTSNGGGVGGA